MRRRQIIQIPCSSAALIEQVKNRPGLWDPEFTSERESRRQLWTEVAREVEPSYDTLNEYEARELECNLRKRWRSLRDFYKRDKREQYKREDKATTKKLRRPKAQSVYPDMLRFLDGQQDDGRQKWLDIIDRPDLITKNYTSHVVCSLHFDDTQMKTKSVKKLVTDAVPTKLLPGQTSTSMDHTNSHCSDVSNQTKQSNIDIRASVQTIKGPDPNSIGVQTSENYKNVSTQTSLALSTDTPRKRKLRDTKAHTSHDNLPGCSDVTLYRKIRELKSEIDESDSKCDENQEEYADIGSGTNNLEPVEEPPRKRLKKHEHNDEKDASNSTAENILGYTEKFAETDDFNNGTLYGDTDKMFLLSFLPELRSLPLNLKMWARTKMCSIIQDAVAMNTVGTPVIEPKVKNECDSDYDD